VNRLRPSLRRDKTTFTFALNGFECPPEKGQRQLVAYTSSITHHNHFVEKSIAQAVKEQMTCRVRHGTGIFAGTFG
jgi:hypothetical protein